ncbi:MAG: heme lyase CcmF/NrfE family subunit [Nannocystaceae bacterium]
MSLSTLGTLVLFILFVVNVATLGLSLVGSRRQDVRMIQGSIRGIDAVAGLSVFASTLIVYAFLAGDYSIRYVAETSDATMPVFYKITSFWGSLEGSLLFWLLLQAVFASIAVRANKRRHADLIPHVVTILAGISLFFVTLILFQSNPFAPHLLETPVSGRGLNPLLQNPYMAIHPPCLYLGYVSLSVPYAFGMAALITGHVDSAWQRAVRRWTLFSWLFLAAGLTLGGLWAYEELGWGGYWAWDPVENAGLLPWFTSTAFLHSIMIQERRGMMRGWNMSLVIISFWLTIVGTFLTRSGVVQSVHAFGANPVLAWTFGGLIVVILVFSFGLLIWRLPLLRSRGELESVFSREFGFLLNNWILLSCSLFVLGGTVYPSISEYVGDRVVLGAPFFEHYMVPLGLALLALTGLGPLLAWRKTTPENLAQQFFGPLAAGAVGLMVPWFLGLRSAWGLACFGLCAFTCWTIVQEFYRGIRVARHGGRYGIVDAAIRLVLRARRRYGGYVVHLGIVLMFLGWGGNSYKVEKKANLRPGDTVELGDYMIRHAGLRATEDWQKEMITADVEVLRLGEADGEPLTTLHPARWWYFKLPEQPTTEVDRYMAVGEDVYVSIQTVDLGTGWTQMSLYVNPLVNWIWVGTMVLLVGGAICIGTRKRVEE